MAKYSYADCLDTSYRINWKISDVLGDRKFDPARPWLPTRLSGAAAISCLDADEKRKLTHVEMGAYAHLFGFVEEFIAPKMSSLALQYEVDEREKYDALTNFAAEEVKHMSLFRAVRQRVDEILGFPLALLENQKAVAHAVLEKSTGAVLLLTACIEWFTQLHYTSAFKDDADVDPLTKEIFRCHWLEESQHAKMDHLETQRCFSNARAAERDKAIDELNELVGAVDGLLREQSRLDIENLGRYLVRKFDEAEKREIYENVLAAKRYTFIESGVEHPNFQEIFGEVTTPQQREKVAIALSTLLQPVGG